MKDTTERKKNPKSNYIKRYKEFLAIEGGLSSEITDRYNCKKKYHTNKGVRYTTFKSIHKTATYKDFILMNDSLYIEVIMYHDKIVKSVYKGKSEAKTLFLIEELWACGHLKPYKDCNSLSLDEMYSIKENRYKKLLKRKPHLNRYKKGWERRRKEFKTFNSQFVM